MEKRMGKGGEGKMERKRRDLLIYTVLLHDSTCVPPLVTGWWFRDIGSARTAVGHSLSLAR